MEATKPLAEILRPKDLKDFVGQAHLIGENGPIEIALKQNAISSMLFWGPPGVGKTSLARIIADKSTAQFLSYSAVYCGVKEIKQAVELANEASLKNIKTIVFIDELHRFNKAQQDIFLPYVEYGTFIFIGATTENPSFEINKALLSRLQVYILNRLTAKELLILVDKATAGVQSIELTADIKDELINLADGDARRLYNLLSEVIKLAQAQNVTKPNLEFINRVLGSTRKSFDKRGEDFYNSISALHKSLRGSDVNAAIYWLMRMLVSGTDPLYIGRRLIRFAWEDIGLADPKAIEITLNAVATYERLGSPEGEIALVGAVSYLGLAHKSNTLYKAINDSRKFVEKNPSYNVPLHLRNAPTKLMKDLNYGKDYLYPHDYKDNFVAGIKYFPDELEPAVFYQPSANGLEAKIKDRLDYLKKLNNKK